MAGACHQGPVPCCCHLSFLCTKGQFVRLTQSTRIATRQSSKRQGGQMDIQGRLFLVMTGVMSVSILAGSASANTATLKCNSHHDQIWVYDSLSNFDVAAKLKCGEDVEIIGRVEGYVKIRAQDNLEGYVAEAAVADLPPLKIYQDPSQDVGLVAKQAQAREIAKAAAREAFPAPADSTPTKTAPVSASDSAVAAQTTSGQKASEGSVAPFAEYAEINPAPVSSRAWEASSGAPAVTTAAAPTVATPSSSASVSVVEATATTISRPADSVAAIIDSNEIPDRQPESDGADPQCQKYFSAYGLTPRQTQWIVQNRKRLFSDVCPAPDPSKVDFVIIFTHDVDFFNSTMPEPVHKSNGFSDFTPMTPIDTALVSESDADKAHREYVWIFQFPKGTFDPASFSPHRQYQFSKMETSSLGSKGSLKTIEDAFRFVATANR
ncbi:MAG: SH3 domain-containing protein [Candidatus Acidiferrales bacterium]